jgi:hypothetical protein
MRLPTQGLTKLPYLLAMTSPKISMRSFSVILRCIRIDDFSGTWFRNDINLTCVKVLKSWDLNSKQHIPNFMVFSAEFTVILVMKHSTCSHLFWPYTPVNEMYQKS